MATTDLKTQNEPTSAKKISFGKTDKHRPPPLDVSFASTSMGPKTPTNTLTTPRDAKEKKIGHRRVDEAGQVTYKKKPTSELMAAIQLGIGQSIGSLTSKPERDVLMQDFYVVDSVIFPGEGSNLTPAHHYSDFRFKTYAPIAFRYFRELFGIQPDDFLVSLCDEPLRELSNPGASGSIFYITNDDEFIIKTVQHKEAEFLQKLLPGYYMNLNQNPRTLLPKFYGLYCYQCGGKNIRFIVMNNLLPTTVKLHEKYDLKGSTYKRKASKSERAKSCPTWKDLDYMELHQEGILLEQDTYVALMKTIARDCRVLESFKIMDYSLLLGVHNIDKSFQEKSSPEISSPGKPNSAGANSNSSENPGAIKTTNLQRNKSMKTRLAAFSTAMESIQAESEPVELEDADVPPGGIPARNSRGERLLLYMGLIDILQSYRAKKKLEHALKAMVHDGDTISVHRPNFYAQRFQNFFEQSVFKKIPSPLKHSPSKKKGASRNRSMTETETRAPEKLRTSSLGPNDERGAIGGRPDLLPTSSTPPPTFAESQAEALHDRMSHDRVSANGQPAVSVRLSSSAVSATMSKTQESITSSNTTSSYHTADSEIQSSRSPIHSLSESTPTHTEFTEGTPSYTASSPSCSSDVLDTSDFDITDGSINTTAQTIVEKTTIMTSSLMTAGEPSNSPASKSIELEKSGDDKEEEENTETEVTYL
ncbi:unnamed protein product [Owenia fusiformis]|uniref:PIPK domain-containing protein n=1 Tax=Owenia fusiformis TaxID=6347 RepID=A0A8S4P4B5_OWEFU|nr:unnamed protein product [Owenia fusiformis]